MLIISPEIEKASADLSQVVAYRHNDDSVEYWDALSKPVARMMWEYGMGAMGRYGSNQVGARIGSAILGCLEDTYPDWVEEFEESI